MLRIKWVTLLVCLLTKGYSQPQFDIGYGERDDFRVATTSLNLIEQNKPAALWQYFWNGYKPDTNYITNNCAAVSAEFPYDNGFPVLFNYDKGSEFTYERNYFENNGSREQCVMQVHIVMIKVGDEIRITDIQFRTGDKIEPRKAELKKVKKKVTKRNPPAGPPPPTGFDE